MKKTFTYILFLLSAGILLTACTAKQSKTEPQRKVFSEQEKKILQSARKIIDSAYFGTFITTDANGDAKARIMEPFTPDKNFTIYLATNPKSRKVQEIKHNPKATLHYFDRRNIGYVSLYGKASIVDNDSIKKALWKEGWERFYKNRDKDYMLIEFRPRYLELISIPDGYTGDDKTWMPARVDFYK